MANHVYREVDLSKHFIEIKGKPLSSDAVYNAAIHIYIDYIEIKCVKGMELIGDIDRKKTTLRLYLREDEALKNKELFEGEHMTPEKKATVINALSGLSLNELQDVYTRVSNAYHVAPKKSLTPEEVEQALKHTI